MNPYVIIVAIVLAIGLWFGGDHVGHVRGINEQKVADQKRFDKINDERTEQTAQANKIYRGKQAENLALADERDKLKTYLEKEREKYRVATNALRDRYAGVGLRFNVFGQDSGHWFRSGRPSGSGDDSSGIAGASFVQLPDQITASLRRIVYDADDLADNYRKCYAYAQRVR